MRLLFQNHDDDLTNVEPGAKLDHSKGKDNKNITFSRRYLDPNRVTFEVLVFSPLPEAFLLWLQFHTKRNNFNFDTSQGKGITKGLNDLAKKFDLSFQFGTAPHDFTINQWV